MYTVTNTSTDAPIKIASNPVVDIPCGGTVELKEATAKFLAERYPWLVMKPVEPKNDPETVGETKDDAESTEEEKELEEPKNEIKVKKSKK